MKQTYIIALLGAVVGTVTGYLVSPAPRSFVDWFEYDTADAVLWAVFGAVIASAVVWFMGRQR